MSAFSPRGCDTSGGSAVGMPLGGVGGGSTNTLGSEELDDSTMIKCFKCAYAHEEMNPRRRYTMEDVHRIVPKLLETDGGKTIYSYFGVYDGHGGRQIVDFLEENLENNIAAEILHEDSASMQERLTRSFLITDMKSRQANIKTSGATAVVGLLKTVFGINSDGTESVSRTLFVGNAGDSRAVIAVRDTGTGVGVSSMEPESIEMPDDELEGDGASSRSSPPQHGHVARRLSFDHRPEDASENKRIKDAGGFITRGRVLGILAVSRSFGDHGMKDFVIAEPYITETVLDGEGIYPFFILACDGVWDVMSDQEAVDLVMERYLISGPFPECADIIVRTAIAKGCGDNVTAIVIFL